MYSSRSVITLSSIVVLFIAPIIVLSTGIISSDLDDIDDEREGRPWRLPNTSYPLKYHLHITTWIHREIFDFTGSVTIELLIKESTSELVLHAKDLVIQKIFIQDLTTVEQILNLKSRIIDDLLVISVANSSERNYANAFIKDHRLRLQICYSGVIRKNTLGFQFITYRNKENKLVYGAYTQMQPTSARKVLPCYDEPGLKAIFAVRIKHGSNFTAISNMPEITSIENDANNMTTTIFQETPEMCTYLLAFVITNFEYISEESDGILHRVFEPPNTEVRGELALANSIRGVRTFDQYMDIPYSLPKIDHAVVGLNKFSGMENWGLITYATYAFPRGKELTSFYQIDTLFHEIVHQWFGNLVSPLWWDSIWLNEGFATYYSYKLADMVSPKLEAIKKHFYRDNCFMDIKVPIIRYVEKPDDIEKMFGPSSYAKASCLLDLLSNIIGEETFHSGVKDFLRARAYSNANGDQFFQHIQTALDNSNETLWKFNVSEVIKPWFTEATQPELLITQNHNNPNIIVIKQIPQESSQGETTRFWWLPLHFGKIIDKNIDSITYFMPPIDKVTLNLWKFNINLQKCDVLVVTIPGITTYKISYDDENMLQIARALQKNPNRINAMQRVVTLRSITRMWKEQTSVVPKLELLKYLRKENDGHVWKAITDGVLNFSNMLHSNDTKLNNALQKFMRSIIAKQYMKYEKKYRKKLAAKDAGMLRALRSLACNFHLDDCLTKSRRRFLKRKILIYDPKNKLFDGSEICFAAKTFTNREFNEILNYLKNADVNSTTMYWSFLRCTDKEKQYREFLRALSDIPSDKNLRKRHLIFWADLLILAAADAMKWNLTFAFLMKQISKLDKFSSATNILCKRVASKAADIRPQFQAQYINLMEQCSKATFAKATKFESSKEMPNLKRIGANYLFQNSHSWQQVKDEAYKWLEAENYVHGF